jgi:phospholipid:diacylglycerol acyltransferase
VIKGNGHDRTETNGGNKTEEDTRNGTTNGAGGEGVERRETGEETQLPVKRTGKRRNGLIFTLGGIFGVFLALFFANQNELSLEALMDLNLDALIDVIPAGVLRDAKQFSVCDCSFFLRQVEELC